MQLFQQSSFIKIARIGKLWLNLMNLIDIYELAAANERLFTSIFL